eukprot:3280329-Amphidinium_carterae.1
MIDACAVPSHPQTDTVITQSETKHQAHKEIGGLLWIVNRTNPDIAALVGILVPEYIRVQTW